MSLTSHQSPTPQPQHVKVIGVVGAGTIGSGWAAHFLSKGLDVIAVDPAVGAEDRMRKEIEQAWSSLKKLGLADSASVDRLQFQPSLDGAFAHVDFVQECTPEVIDVKQNVLEGISRAVRPHVVIASSASYLTASEMQEHCIHPERMLVGHPFHPVYLLPLVEVVGGEKTSPFFVEWAVKFYRKFGHKPLHCRKEVPGHIGNRLQRALFMEGLRMVTEGIATTAEVDAAVTDAAGLRLGLFGPFMTRAMAGGDAGPRTVLERQRANNISSDKRPGDPELTDDLIDQLTTEMIAQVDGRTIKALEAARNNYLVELIKLKNAALASSYE